ncbi:MAG: hypothetical protein A4E71_01786 [Smithella sp. PtaU1.Bin162]|nr:MAG: hypothetical protein A4E71_01786 [Smithella sp. PtaU1.Bin162]
MRASTIKDIFLHLARIAFLSALQVSWLFCGADLLFSYALGGKISVWNIVPVYFASLLLNVAAVHTLRFLVGRVILNCLAVAFLFVAVWPFNLAVPLISSAHIMTGGAPDIFLGLSVIIVTAIYWYQGLRLASMAVGFEQCLAEFQFGFLMFLVIFFFHAVAGVDKNYFAPVIIFFVCGLISLFFSRRERLASTEGFSVVIDLAALICVGLTVISGLSLAVIFNPALAAKLYLAGKSVLNFILNLIMQVMRFLAGFFSGSDAVLPPPPPSAPKTPGDPAVIANLFNIPPAVRKWLQMLVGGLFISMIAAALWSVSRQIAESIRRRKKGIPADVHKLNSSYLKNIFVLIKNSAAAFMRKMQWLYIRRRGRHNDSLTMKFVYGQILRWAAMSGCRKKVSATPAELYPQLSFWLPEAAAEIGFITEQFVQVRYGEIRLTEDTRKQVWESYKKIKQRKKLLFFKRRRR